ncbi:uncharacterized protein LOC100573372 isoform X2 [Acyrthosiphon pisum]|uniref:Protein SirB1 N-terminal domain-containing protein n=1 Tax=Acyrthosiphon pisum TaxID=7029 RepID=A0A8R2D721_ACYPI|nr:uncharacterized protein LOC100573372 isoform X2 [Acyrthosiphon pisum]|eukprot:XP_016663713.1 PREDICTED: uncharacterized protein LOC100573372 isoform X2 [Acyrthosiphon pisum]
MTTNDLKPQCDPDDEIVVPAYSSTNSADTVTTSSANTATTTILDLPTELIEYICCYDSLKLIDVFNLAVSHSKLKNSLFHERNSCLWKSKFIQKYGLLDDEEYRVVIDEQNTWKDEIMLRMCLDKAVPAEIIQMPCKYMKFKNIPYHSYPLSQYLHSKNEGHRYYILSATAAYYNQLQSNKCNENYDLLYMAHQFLIYSCQVYFGYKIRNFLSLPPAEQIVERGFYLLERCWCPTVDITYRDINKSLNNIAIDVCNRICSANPVHPLFANENCLQQVVERGKFNLDHDLFDETSTMFILENISKIIFSEDQLVCHCNNDLNCFFLQKVIERRKGSAFLLCVIFESVARRLGVKVIITPTAYIFVDSFVSWSSSWPGNKCKNPTCYVIDIAGFGVLEKVSSVSGELQEQYIRNSILDLFWSFSQNVKFISATNKYVWDFQTFLKPDDSDLESSCRTFFEFYDYCGCPLLRNPTNPYAPNHEDEENNINEYENGIFPLEPRRRGKSTDPKFSIGMIIEVLSTKSNNVISHGIIVGWERLAENNSSPTTVYHALAKPWKGSYFESPEIIILRENRNEKLQRQLKPDDFRFMNIGKFFTHYSHEMCAFVPIKSLAQLYPDDLSCTSV